MRTTSSETFDAILNHEVDFPSPQWDGVSKDAKDFIQCLLCKDPQDRMSVAAAIQHSWFRDGGSTKLLNIKENMIQFWKFWQRNTNEHFGR